MPTLGTTYDIREDFDVNADLSDNASLHSSWTGAAVSPFWNANFTDVTVSGGRLNSLVTLAGVSLDIGAAPAGYATITVVSMTVEAQFSTPLSGFSSLRLGAFDADENEISPTIRLNSDGSALYGLNGSVVAVSPTPASTHVLKMVVTAGYNIAFYIDGSLVGTLAGITARWTRNALLSIRSGAYVEYIEITGANQLSGDVVPPHPPAAPFWTGFVNAYEVVGLSADPAPPGDGSSHNNPIDITTPYEANLLSLNGTPKWYRVTVAAGNWKFSTATSPDPSNYDTYLALFNAAGNVVATNEDIDTPGNDFRSQIITTLPAGTYYLALSTFEGGAANGFNVTAGTTIVPSGTILKVEAA